MKDQPATSLLGRAVSQHRSLGGCELVPSSILFPARLSSVVPAHKPRRAHRGSQSHADVQTAEAMLRDDEQGRKSHVRKAASWVCNSKQWPTCFSSRHPSSCTSHLLTQNPTQTCTPGQDSGKHFPASPRHSAWPVCGTEALVTARRAWCYHFDLCSRISNSPVTASALSVHVNPKEADNI